MQDFAPGTIMGTLLLLCEKGIRYTTVIDIGCADGHFFLQCHALGLVPGAAPVNIDANAVYADSLKAIQDVFGGHYFMGAISDQPRTIEMTASAHPYWNSVRPPDDPYWQRLNGLSGEKIKVEAATLDGLADKLQLKPPFLLKLDIQGAEVQALRGAARVLENTEAVVCEADLDDFQDINHALVDAGFGIFDLAEFHRLPDRTLGWMYPVYLNRKRDNLRSRAIWDKTRNDQAIAAQQARRETILRDSAALLARERARRNDKGAP